MAKSGLKYEIKVFPDIASQCSYILQGTSSSCAALALTSEQKRLLKSIANQATTIF